MHSRRHLYIGLPILVAALLVALLIAHAWHTHTTRTHIAQAIKAADGAKLVVMEGATTRGGLDKLTAADLAYDGTSATSPYVARLTLGAGGKITVATRNTGATPDPVLELVPVEAASPQGPAPIQWNCLVIRGSADAAGEDCKAAAPASASTATTAQ